MCPVLDEPSSSYFRPRAWRETDTTFIQVERDSLSLFGGEVDTFQSNNIIIVVIACRKCSWPWKAPLKCLAAAHRIFLSWMSGASPKQAERLLERPHSSTSKTLVIVQQCSTSILTSRLLHWKSINAIPRRGQWKVHIFLSFFVIKEQFPTLIHSNTILLNFQLKSQIKRDKKIINMFSPQSRTTYKGKTHASYFTLRPSE